MIFFGNKKTADFGRFLYCFLSPGTVQQDSSGNHRPNTSCHLYTKCKPVGSSHKNAGSLIRTANNVWSVRRPVQQSGRQKKQDNPSGRQKECHDCDYSGRAADAAGPLCQAGVDPLQLFGHNL